MYITHRIAFIWGPRHDSLAAIALPPRRFGLDPRRCHSRTCKSRLDVAVVEEGCSYSNTRYSDRDELEHVLDEETGVARTFAILKQFQPEDATTSGPGNDQYGTGYSSPLSIRKSSSDTDYECKRVPHGHEQRPANILYGTTTPYECAVQGQQNICKSKISHDLIRRNRSDVEQHWFPVTLLPLSNYLLEYILVVSERVGDLRSVQRPVRSCMNDDGDPYTRRADMRAWCTSRAEVGCLPNRTTVRPAPPELHSLPARRDKVTKLPLKRRKVVFTYQYQVSYIYCIPLLRPFTSFLEGEWSRDKRFGYGIYHYPNGDTYAGSWKNGLQDGMGNYTYKVSGAKFIGTWASGQMRGPGKLIRPQNCYHGSWENNLYSVLKGAVQNAGKSTFSGTVGWFAASLGRGKFWGRISVISLRKLKLIRCTSELLEGALVIRDTLKLALMVCGHNFVGLRDKNFNYLDRNN
ncbi:hypothetical protein PR048_000986 [Dryococelus australis]|uniref:Uncharacterized protein n=1 Tax=Dryococelus australis TaxID=614101 RepID=A0ABQ9IG38_9NEOP|nr:hypothetical protein PR048_000986 [Dryococelus australis]